MARSKVNSSIEPVASASNLNIPAPILIASMMVLVIAMVASAASGFS